MQILPTLVFMILAVTAAHAEPERKLLRSGYDAPMDFSDLTHLDETTGTSSKSQGQPGLDSITKSGLVPSADSLPIGGGSSIGKNAVPADLSPLAGRSGLQSLTQGGGLGSITDSVDKGGKSPINGGSATNGLTDNLPGLSDGLGLPATSPSGKKTGAMDESSERALTRPKKTSPPSKKTSKKKTTKKKTTQHVPNRFVRPNVEKTPTPGRK